MHVPVGIGYIVIRGKSIKNTVGPPGIRTNPDGSPRSHDGWDIACAVGSPVYAVLDGEVVAADRTSTEGYGKIVILKVEFSGKTYFVLYAHLSSIKVQVGDRVAEGDVLGRSGQSGNARSQRWSEAHLHFEVRAGVHGPVLDPGLLLGNGAIGDVLQAEIREAFSIAGLSAP